MLDPLGPAPTWLRSVAEPFARSFNLPALSDHVHEILLAFTLFQSINSVISPALSRHLLPQFYNAFDQRTKINWNVHVVSFVQSTVINVLALWVIFTDEERKHENASERVYGYTGACGLITALATGYFLFDLMMCVLHFKVFGVGMFFHAVSALWVFSFGFRPFVNFYAPNFILYELSSPFLNIHWFLDKLNMTGSRAQWYNGMILIGTFFSCRLIWGTWQSAVVFADMWKALEQTWSANLPTSLEPIDIASAVFQARKNVSCVDDTCVRANAEVAKFARFATGGVPTWLVFTYVTSNLILNSLNWYWFSKMIETVMKRFREPSPAEEKKKKREAKDKDRVKGELANDLVLDAAAKLEQEEGRLSSLGNNNIREQIASAVDTTLGEEVRRRADKALS